MPTVSSSFLVSASEFNEKIRRESIQIMFVKFSKFTSPRLMLKGM